MSDALPLPPRPNLAQYKKLAKELQQACRSSDPGAIPNRVARWVEKLARLQGLKLTPQIRRQMNREARRLEQLWRKSTVAKEGSPRCTLAAAQLYIARGHGFVSWPKFAAHLEGLARAASPVSKFESAVDAIVDGDLEKLRKLLSEEPGLVRARSTREHRSTLLHYVSANGVEDFRQKTPKNILEITKLLLDTGAEVDAESDAYGGGSTTLGLVATSIHPQRADVQIVLLQLLLDRGAKIANPSGAGNRHSAVHGCLANGQPEAAEFLASRGAHVDLEGAAGLGRLVEVRSYFDKSGGLQPRATRRQVESAFESACWYGRKEVVEFLLGTGIDAGMANSAGQTGLHCAAYGAHVEVIRLLLERGAPADAKEKNHQAAPLDVALWLWTNSSDAAQRERCYEVIALLARAGAKFDAQRWDDPGSGEPGVLERIRSDARVSAALRGETPG